MFQEIESVLASPLPTLPAFIAAHAATRPDHIALRQDDESISYQELDQIMDRLAQAFKQMGLQQGDKISVCAYTSLAYCQVFLATLRAGMTIVPLAPSSSPEQLAAMIADCGAPIVFLDTAMQAHLAGQTLSAEIHPLQGAHLADLMRDSTAFEAVAISPETNFNIIYSSGTTGVPKGIVQSHGMRLPMMIPKDPPGYGPDAVTLLSTPLYSNTTMTSFLPTLAGGGTVILMEKFEVQAYLALAESWRVTHTMLVPVQYRRIMADPSFDSFDLSAFDTKFCTSAPFAAALKADVLKRWPGGLIEYYGMTEGGGGCALVAHHYPDKLHTVGRPLPGHEIFTINEAGERCAPGEIGEIVGCSGAIMKGYHNQPTKTREAEWFDADGRRHIRTGDIGFFDEDGFLTLMDRKKDMIISGGFNIYPSDIEAILVQHPHVIETAIVGVPSERWGETPVAYVVVTDDARADLAQILLWLNEKLGKTQRVSDICATHQLPRSAIGKVLKRELVDLYKEQMATTA
jgi:long-chain acyl-CoA synthetase